MFLLLTQSSKRLVKEARRHFHYHLKPALGCSVSLYTVYSDANYCDSDNSRVALVLFNLFNFAKLQLRGTATTTTTRHDTYQSYCRLHMHMCWCYELSLAHVVRLFHDWSCHTEPSGAESRFIVFAVVEWRDEKWNIIMKKKYAQNTKSYVNCNNFFCFCWICTTSEPTGSVYVGLSWSFTTSSSRLSSM